MVSPAEKELVRQLHDFLDVKDNNINIPSILNIGAGQSTSIEKQLSSLECKYRCDRIDIEDCSVTFPTVRHCWIGSVEEMTLVGSNEYVASFANYVLEHVLDLHKAAREIHRVLRSSGIFVASLPNTIAPEFLLAKRTPLWFHKMARRIEAWETFYSYNNIPELIEIFKVNGFILHDAKYWSFTEGYLTRYPLVSTISRLYDRFVSTSQIKQLMGNVCITFKKPK